MLQRSTDTIHTWHTDSVDTATSTHIYTHTERHIHTHFNSTDIRLLPKQLISIYVFYVSWTLVNVYFVWMRPFDCDIVWTPPLTFIWTVDTRKRNNPWRFARVSMKSAAYMSRHGLGIRSQSTPTMKIWMESSRCGSINVAQIVEWKNSGSQTHQNFDVRGPDVSMYVFNLQLSPEEHWASRQIRLIFVRILSTPQDSILLNVWNSKLTFLIANGNFQTYIFSLHLIISMWLFPCCASKSSAMAIDGFVSALLQQQQTNKKILHFVHSWIDLMNWYVIYIMVPSWYNIRLLFIFHSIVIFQHIWNEPDL